MCPVEMLVYLTKPDFRPKRENSRVPFSTTQNSKSWVETLAQPFKSRYPHTNSPDRPSYISLKNSLREFDIKSKFFPCDDHFISSHNFFY